MTSKTSECVGGFCHKLSANVSEGLGKIFYRLGFFVALHPWPTILICCFGVICCSIGLLTFHNEKNPLKLWIPQNSKFIDDTDWLMKTFKEAYRPQSVLITAPNVLDPSVLKKVSYISSEVTKLKASLNNGTIVGWNDVCFKIPYIADVLGKKRKKRMADHDDNHSLTTTERPFEPSVDLFSSIFCGIIDMLPLGCYQENILELWKFDDNEIGNLTSKDILEAINKTTVSPTSGHDTDFVHLLGGIKRDSSGYIVSATSLLTHWMVYINFSAVDHDKNGNIAGTEDWASEEALVWEKEYLLKMNELEKELSDNETGFYYTAGRSYGDISAEVMFQDMDKLFIGGFLMFIYMEIVLSKFSWVELRIILGLMGLLSVGMAFISAIGICSIFGVSYGPVHTSLPFLLMGLGVDDIFVIMACWRQIETLSTGCTIPERMGLMLKHAGASITITSFTDVVAFMIGATTVLPSLESFCIFAAVGIFLTYIFAITFVIAVFTLDQKRIEKKRNAFVPCITHENYKDNLWCAQNFMQRSLKMVYSKFIFSNPGKVFVIISAFCFAGVSFESLLKLKQKFDPTWFIPERTYMHRYIVNQHEYYPDMGFGASVYMGSMNYSTEFPKILSLAENIKNRSDIVHDLTSAWPKPFHEFVKIYYEKDIQNEIVSDEDWHYYLTKFLFSHSGGKYQPRFKFKTKLKCGEPAPEILVSSFEFKYRKFSERNDYVPAMHTMEDMVNDAKLNGFATIWAKIYGNWITDEVIDTEVLRNIILALICVMACTFLLIVNFEVCFYIFACVLLTLINVCGFMERWGLTIDLVSCIGLQLAVGLCVDYAAHIGHTFLMISDGTRTERAEETISHIGAAVLYGGGSTLLALSMLAGSDAYTFKAFFRIFLLVIIFGLYHGVVFLPVLLSLIGPKPYSSYDERIEKYKENQLALEEDSTEMISIIRPKENNNKEIKENILNDKGNNEEKLAQNCCSNNNEDLKI